MIRLMELVVVWYRVTSKRGPNQREAFNGMMFIFLSIGLTVGFTFGVFMGRI